MCDIDHVHNCRINFESRQEGPKVRGFGCAQCETGSKLAVGKAVSRQGGPKVRGFGCAHCQAGSELAVGKAVGGFFRMLDSVSSCQRSDILPLREGVLLYRSHRRCRVLREKATVETCCVLTRESGSNKECDWLPPSFQPCCNFTWVC
jgi:hypothetical protein